MRHMGPIGPAWSSRAAHGATHDRMRVGGSPSSLVEIARTTTGASSLPTRSLHLRSWSTTGPSATGLGAPAVQTLSSGRTSLLCNRNEVCSTPTAPPSAAASDSHPHQSISDTPVRHSARQADAGGRSPDAAGGPPQQPRTSGSGGTLSRLLRTRRRDPQIAPATQPKAQLDMSQPPIIRCGSDNVGGGSSTSGRGGGARDGDALGHDTPGEMTRLASGRADGANRSPPDRSSPNGTGADRSSAAPAPAGSPSASTARPQRPGGGSASGVRQSTQKWLTWCTPLPLDADLTAFAAAVASGAASWHPVQISAALNHAAKLADALDRKDPPGRRGGGSGGGRSGDGGGGRGSGPGGSSLAAAEATLRVTLDILQAAFLPHVHGIINSRYAVNALWVCAKMGYWGAPGSGFVPAILTRLRQDRYALLRTFNGQDHGNLWWALSQYGSYDKQQQQQQVPEGTALGSGTDCVPAVAAAAADGRDLLHASAAAIKTSRALDNMALRPQVFSNILLAVSRLERFDDPEFVHRVLGCMAQHPGPLQPQDVSTTMYALGKLYGTGSRCSTAPSSECSTSSWEDRGIDGAKLRRDHGEAVVESSMRLPPVLALHLQTLAGKALRAGFHYFNPQALSNSMYGLARLGLRMGAQTTAVSGAAGASQPQQPAPFPQAPQWGQIPQQLRRLPHSSDPSQHERSPDAMCDPDDDLALRRFVAAMAEHLRDRLERDPLPFGPQALSNATWSLATMGYVDQSYYMAAVKAAIQGGCMKGALPQEWATFLWALVETKHRPPRELVRLLYGSVVRVPSLWGPAHSQELSMVLWALAAQDRCDADVVTCITNALRDMDCCRTMDEQALASCLWSLAVMPEGAIVRHAELVSLLVEAADRREPQQFSNMELTQLWQVHVELEAAINGQPPTTCDDRASGSASRGSPRAAVATAQQYGDDTGSNRQSADANAAPGSVASAASTPATVLVSAVAGTPAAVAPAPAPAAALRRLRPHLTSSGRTAMLEANPPRAGAGASRSLLQRDVFRCLTHMTTGSTAAAASAPGAVAVEEQQAHRRQARTPQHRQRRDPKARRQTGGETSSGEEPSDDTGRSTGGSAGGAGGAVVVVVCRVEQEWLVEALGVRVDMCVWLSDGRQMVVEVDGPSHFFRNYPQTRQPNTALRDRQLGRVFGAGNVKTVPYWEWDAVKTAEAKTAYLTRLLGL